MRPLLLLAVVIAVGVLASSSSSTGERDRTGGCIRAGLPTPLAGIRSPEPAAAEGSVGSCKSALQGGGGRVIARFVGELGEVGLPKERVKVVPIGYDPNFLLPVRKVRVLEGTLRVQGGGINFLIHSPALFFMRNLGELPAGNHAEGPFLFELVADVRPEGTAYDLCMSRVEPGARRPSP